MEKKGRKASENQNQENIKVRELVEIIKALKQRNSLYHCQTEQIIDRPTALIITQNYMKNRKPERKKRGKSQ